MKPSAVRIAIGVAVLLCGGAAAAYVASASSLPTLLVLGAFALVAVPVLLITSVASWRPEALVVVGGVLVIAAGLVTTGIDVRDASREHRITYRGKLDVERIRDQFSPGLGPEEKADRHGYGYLLSAEGTTKSPEGVPASAVRWWAVGRFAPWVLAAIALALVFPVLRSAGRGDPFLPDAAVRFGLLGVLLLVGIPGVDVLQWHAGTGGGSFIVPAGDSAELQITGLAFLPGVIAFVLAGVFRRGAELRDLELHTV